MTVWSRGPVLPFHNAQSRLTTYERHRRDAFTAGYRAAMRTVLDLASRSRSDMDANDTAAPRLGRRETPAEAARPTPGAGLPSYREHGDESPVPQQAGQGVAPTRSESRTC